jgi:hypothetical protein
MEENMRDVTSFVAYKHVNSSVYQIEHCVCGAEFADYMNDDEQPITICCFNEDEKPTPSKACPKCGREFVMVQEFHIYET